MQQFERFRDVTLNQIFMLRIYFLKDFRILVNQPLRLLAEIT